MHQSVSQTGALLDIYTVIEAFVCRQCGEGVSVERPVQWIQTKRS
jgi:hypothetical protein